MFFTDGTQPGEESFGKHNWNSTNPFLPEWKLNPPSSISQSDEKNS
jgi:hypothetical protein